MTVVNFMCQVGYGIPRHLVKNYFSCGRYQHTEVASSNPWKAKEKEKAEVELPSLTHCLGYQSPASGVGTTASAPLVFKPLCLDFIWSIAFLDFCR